MITVYTNTGDADEFPNADVVDVTQVGVLIISESIPLEGNDEGFSASTVAIYAPGAWEKVDRDESSTRLMCFLEEHELTEAWMKYMSGEDEAE